MTSFVVGQLVRCTNPGHSENKLLLNAVYEVETAEVWCDIDCVILKGMEEMGHRFAHRFIPFEWQVGDQWKVDFDAVPCAHPDWDLCTDRKVIGLLTEHLKLSYVLHGVDKTAMLRKEWLIPILATGNSSVSNETPPPSPTTQQVEKPKAKPMRCLN